MPLFARAAAWPRRVGDMPRVLPLNSVLMADPSAFAVEEIHNPHSAGADGAPNRIDLARAVQQWRDLAEAYRHIGVRVESLPAAPGLPDLCFSANPTLFLPTPAGGEVWASRMTHASRRPEVDLHHSWFTARGMRPREMSKKVVRFEGGGDGIPHPGRFLLHAGIGPRSERGAWEEIAAAQPQMDVLAYQLRDPRFYHLDTALAALDEHRCLYVPEAFDAEGLDLLRTAFDDAIAIPLEEAMNFAGNAHCPDGRHVLLQRGSPRTEAALCDRGFVPVSLDTGEFMKSGGSVFCLKQAFGGA
jgi:N-dimethylarginine dimethylaminohydrolase